jgi:outer membrane protein insertion porin family
LWFPVAVPAQFEGDPIDRVEIDGLVSYRPEEVLSRLKTQAAKPYQPLDAQEDLRALARIMRNAAYDLEPTPDGQLVVRFRVVEFPRLGVLQVIGNVKLTTERIETLLALKPGESVLDADTLESARRALDREYQALGRPATRVTINLIDAAETEAGKRPGADLQIVIDEGEQILCKDMIVRGNKVFSTTRLKSILQTNGSWLFLKNYYSEDLFEEDLQRLRDFYAAQGYFDATIARGAFEVSRAKGRPVVSPVVEIAEGERYVLGEVDVRGARLFSRAEILAPFRSLHDKPFDGPRFAEALEKATSLYADHGLLTTQFRPDYTYDAPAHRLNVMLQIVEHERIYVGRIQVVRPNYDDLDDDAGWFRKWYGRVAPPVADEVIAREILLKPGEIYDRALERDSARRLARLGVFDLEKLSVHGSPTRDPGVHDVVVEAADNITGAHYFGIGFGDADGAYLEASFVERNFGGRADVLSIGGRLGTRTSSASIRFLNRHLGDTLDSLDSRIFFELQTRPGYRAHIGGGHFEWSHPLAESWTRRLRARFEGVKLEERDGIDAHEDLDRVYPVATLRLRFEQDARWPPGGPTREGYVQSVGVEAGYAGAPLLNLDAARDQYIPLTDRLTWRLFASAGVIPYHRDVLPIHERHFLGGNNDLRGFAYRGAGYFDEDEDDVPIGGAIKTLLKNELIFPIYKPISGVLFADVGSLAASPTSWEMPRASTGAGLLFDMRQMQVGLYLAAPVATRDDDQTRFFHFSLQSQF